MRDSARGNLSNFHWITHTLGLRAAAAAFIGGRMRYAMTIIVVLLRVTMHGCATDKHLTPPDSVLDPRGQ